MMIVLIKSLIVLYMSHLVHSSCTRLHQDSADNCLALPLDMNHSVNVTGIGCHNNSSTIQANWTKDREAISEAIDLWLYLRCNLTSGAKILISGTYKYIWWSKIKSTSPLEFQYPSDPPNIEYCEVFGCWQWDGPAGQCDEYSFIPNNNTLQCRKPKTIISSSPAINATTFITLPTAVIPSTSSTSSSSRVVSSSSTVFSSSSTVVFSSSTVVSSSSTVVSSSSTVFSSSSTVVSSSSTVVSSSSTVVSSSSTVVSSSSTVVSSSSTVVSSSSTVVSSSLATIIVPTSTAITNINSTTSAMNPNAFELSSIIPTSTTTISYDANNNTSPVSMEGKIIAILIIGLVIAVTMPGVIFIFIFFVIYRRMKESKMTSDHDKGYYEDCQATGVHMFNPPPRPFSQPHPIPNIPTDSSNNSTEDSSEFKDASITVLVRDDDNGRRDNITQGILDTNSERMHEVESPVQLEVTIEEANGSENTTSFNNDYIFNGVVTEHAY